jgi:hypothetical protein
LQVADKGFDPAAGLCPIQMVRMLQFERHTF